MTTKFSFLLLSLGLLVSGCATLLAGSDVQSGRQALLIGDNDSALSYFRSAAERDPNYL